MLDFIDNFSKEPWKYVKPILWNDKDKSPYFIENLTKSHRFEIYIEKLLEHHGIQLGLYYSREEQYQKGENELGIWARGQSHPVSIACLKIKNSTL